MMLVVFRATLQQRPPMIHSHRAARQSSPSLPALAANTNHHFPTVKHLPVLKAKGDGLTQEWSAHMLVGAGSRVFSLITFGILMLIGRSSRRHAADRFKVPEETQEEKKRRHISILGCQTHDPRPPHFGTNRNCRDSNRLNTGEHVHSMLTCALSRWKQRLQTINQGGKITVDATSQPSSVKM